MLNSLEVATKFIQSGEPVTAEIINKILSIYNLHITEEGLSLLVNTPRLKFDHLSKSLYKDSKFLEQLGKTNDREVKGVYIFTHKKTGSKYVGSSIQLASRLQRYLSGNHREYGKFIPFVNKEGLQNFSLEVMPLHSSVIFKGELILEQYFLLDPYFNLNTSRVVNQPKYNTKEIFMYNKNKTLLIYHSANMQNFLVKFGISYRVILNNLETGSFYLGKYVFSSLPILTAKEANYSEEEINTMLTKDRKNLDLFMYNKDKSVLYYSGIKADFSRIGLYIWKNSNVNQYIDTDLLYLDKYVLTTQVIPEARKVDMSIEELSDMLNQDKKGIKGVFNKSRKVILEEIESGKILNFKSLSKCVEYFKSLGFTTTSSTLKSRIESGKELNGYCAKWDDDPTFIHNKAKAINIKNLDTGLIKTYNSFREASRDTNIWTETLKKYLKLKEPYKNFLIWYVEEESQ